MDSATIDRLKEDFRKWSGGFPPESQCEVTVYLDYAIALDVDKAEARRTLLDWMEEGEPEVDGEMQSDTGS